MAGNRFNIPTFDIDLLNWANNARAFNANRARERQQDWNNVFGAAAGLGKQIRAEQEAEKARQAAAKAAALREKHQDIQAQIQREFQAEEAEKARKFQSEQKELDRKAQDANSKAMIDAEKQKNLGKVNAEIAVLEANRDRELGNIDAGDEKTKALINAQFNANKRNLYAKYGIEQPTLDSVPTLPVSQNVETNEKPVDVIPTNDVLTSKQQEIEKKKIIDDLEQRKRQIATMAKGPNKVAAMKQFNSDSNGLIQGYTTEEIKNAEIHIPVYNIGQVVPSDKVETIRKWYKLTFSPSKDGYVITGKR